MRRAEPAVVAVGSIDGVAVVTSGRHRTTRPSDVVGFLCGRTNDITVATGLGRDHVTRAVKST